ncbi:DNA-binding winged helix-turn-helix (wHTH) protein [Novosphingobium kunmingense]|uniref:DNA-binding winged helix-turn-helix (WHTH) protein n=1 Tax=Novosphingobium kunmingense TaxID=1211806 RepID=A0A2N0I3Y1_9SPHN|nr:winged helix-turn-helix domain-containing protein [Novosphingobium kunmingense]PKB25904.1 DNA-binding winged helix-turn-helix (wHTH) protein [Novosphingobium kunmingense]
MNDDTTQAPESAKPPLARRADFALGTVTVRPSLRIVEGPGGSIKAEPRVMQVLVALADARGSVLSRDDLLQQCWDGRIVGDDAINRAVAELRRVAAAAAVGFEVETVPRVGFRLTGIDWNAVEAEQAPGGKRHALSRRLAIGAGGGALALAGLGSAFWLESRRDAVDDLVEQGKLLRANGFPKDREKARDLFRQAIARDPGRADAWGWLAVTQTNLTAEREAAQRALTLDPREPNARTVLALQRRDLDGWNRLEDVLLDILSDAPGNAEALAILTIFYQGLGRCRESLHLNERAIAVEPFEPSHQARRALKHWIFGNPVEAMRVIDHARGLWPHNSATWNARMVITAFSGRGDAALAQLDDKTNRPTNLAEPSLRSWRAIARASATREPADLARAEAVCTQTAPLSPGLAANAIMAMSYLGRLDSAFDVASGLFEMRGKLVQRPAPSSFRDFYSEPGWGRSQFLFIPATSALRADARFPAMCQRTGHLAYWRARNIWPDPFVRGAIDPAKFG